MQDHRLGRKAASSVSSASLEGSQVFAQCICGAAETVGSAKLPAPSMFGNCAGNWGCMMGKIHLAAFIG
jgi:hypothetical protein